MKKVNFCVSLVLTGLMTACVDKNEVVDADSKPSWLGGSIYQELKNPEYLTGTFSTYLKLIDDLGYAETLNRTGSKTVFPANDEAFARFFQSNDWGVSSYAGLSEAQKKMLLYSSMLDNALLINMLSNVSNTSGTDGTVTKGMAVKHQTALNVTDTIRHITSESEMPRSNAYWDKYREAGKMYVVSDATRPMMVHFTREHMLNNSITTLGDESDFAVLTGSPYTEGVAYIFDDKIVQSDITCQNGYIHQMENVIVPPGNMAQVLRSDVETSYFSRMLDYFCAPYENKTVTDNYNATALEKGQPTIDMIYEMRYLNNLSAHKQATDPDGNIVTSSHLLDWDPGWNQYSPLQASGGVDYTIADIGAMFVPTDQAVKDFFLEGGDGSYLIDLYGVHQGSQNTEAHLAENLDSMRSKRLDIFADFVKNLMKQSFVDCVPSKFTSIASDAGEYMGISLDNLHKRSDGRYDIKIANNGVIYKMDELIAPDKYQSVMAPSTVYPDMSVMNWAVTDDATLGVSFHYYLMAMKSNFAFFIPDDEAFEKYYIDPVYLGRPEPRALKFSIAANGSVQAVAYHYDPVTNEVGEAMNSGAVVPVAQWKSLFIDILNYHTVVLDDGQTVGGNGNHYYKTKHGGEVYVSANAVGGQVMSGQQIDNGIAAAKIENVYNEKNGTAYRIDHVIESPRNSVSKTLQQNSQFSDFYALCAGFSASALLTWAGISDQVNDFGTTEQDAYIIFTSDRGSGTNKVAASCLDENVKMFNTYNYTLYAPNNTAMAKAYAAGLPRWEDIQAIYERYMDNEDEDAVTAAKAQAKELIDMLKDFARYHFQSVSIYADNTVESGRYNSLSTDNLGLAIELQVSGGSNKIDVTDQSGNTITIDATDASKKHNLMTRDYWFDREKTSATSIYTTSFCVIHEIDTPLNSGQSGLTWK